MATGLHPHHVVRAGRPGFTLLETIIASFLLLMGFLVSLQVFDAAIRYEASAETKSLAVLTASNKLEEIGAWNTQNHYPAGSIPFSDWSHYQGVVSSDILNPQFTITVTCLPVAPLFTPCTTFESVYLPAGPLVLSPTVTVANDTRTMPNCLEQVVVNVNLGSQSFNWTAMFAPPPANFAALNPQVVVSDASGASLSGSSLGHDQTINAVTKLVDAGGNTIDGATFSWLVLGPGNGVLTATRDGREAAFVNHFFVKGTKKIYLDGEVCQLQAQAFFMGHEVTGSSGPITL
jgi:hypothetical protein